MVFTKVVSSKSEKVRATSELHKSLSPEERDRGTKMEEKQVNYERRRHVFLFYSVSVRYVTEFKLLHISLALL